MFVVFSNLDEEHELARGVGGADNSLRVQSPLKAPEPLSSPGHLLLLLSLELPLVPRPGLRLLLPPLELLKIINDRRGIESQYAGDVKSLGQ